MNQYICIHGHFYQPPRENPWLEEVEVQDSAYPYHDWNERITNESYAPNTSSRILDKDKNIIDMVNNYKKISFNFGPTLLSWLQRHQPEVYQAILTADIKSRNIFSGHGSALAQVYNHIIMPLANSRDKRTQIIWGIKDFKYRFQRKPEGMWLSETAVDLETLDILAEHQIKFTILAPRQAYKIKKINEPQWENVEGGKIDTRMPYLCRLPSGRTITLFFYNGSISRDIAFGELLRNGELFARRLVDSFSNKQKGPELVNIATDGETYGHHQRHGDMALAYCLYDIESKKNADITIYADFLEKFPAAYEVEIFENSSWSCIHGIERWRTNCGCNSGMNNNWHQNWRAPLREAFDYLRDQSIKIYEDEATPYIKDPWKARDDYIDIILNRTPEKLDNFLYRHALKKLSEKETTLILKLLEIQRHAMLMYTSCGWFFDEISGIETIQIMLYAFRVIQLVKEINNRDMEPDYVNILSRAESNIARFKNGALIHKKYIKYVALDFSRVAAHYSISSLFNSYSEISKIYCYSIQSEINDFLDIGIQKMVIGKIRIQSDITLEKKIMSFAIIHFGGHNLSGGVREYQDKNTFINMHKEIKNAFTKNNIPEVIRLMDKYFINNNQYSLWHLFKDEQKKIINLFLKDTIKELESFVRMIFEHHYSVFHIMSELNINLPKAVSSSLALIFNSEICNLLKKQDINFKQLQKLIKDTNKWSLDLDKTTLEFIASEKINVIIKAFSEDTNNIGLLKTINVLFNILKLLELKLNIWKAQNIYFNIKQKYYNIMLGLANDNQDITAQKWIKIFKITGNKLQVGIK